MILQYCRDYGHDWLQCRCDPNTGWFGGACADSSGSKGACTDTRCGGAAVLCCEGSTALQKKEMCQGSVDCDSCCGWVVDGSAY